MPEDSVRRSDRGSTGRNILGIVAGLSVIFVIVVASGSTLFPSRPGTGVPSETADHPRQAVLGIILLQGEICPRKARMNPLLMRAPAQSKSQTQKSPVA
jgi:hypothetical protein